MDDVIGVYQKQPPDIGVDLITLPPGLLLQAIKAGGWTYAGKDYHGLPAICASVNLDHLKQLKAANMMDSYRVYMHNEPKIMVAKGYPKRSQGWILRAPMCSLSSPDCQQAYVKYGFVNASADELKPKPIE